MTEYPEEEDSNGASFGRQPLLSSTNETMTVAKDSRDSKDPKNIPLLNKITPRNLQRQTAHDVGHITLNLDSINGTSKNSSKRFQFTRADSVVERYISAGKTGSNRKYTIELLQEVDVGDYDKCKHLLEKDNDIEATDEETGFTALHVAVKNAHFNIVSLLLEKGANCNSQDKLEQTPLHLAALKHHSVCAEILLAQHNLKINQLSKTNDTPLHYAAKEGRYDICEMILQHSDIKVDAKNKRGMTPMHYASQEDQKDILQLLLNNNADWKKQDNHSYLPIHYAAQKGYPDCCMVLLSNCSEDDKLKQLRTCVKDGKTSLMLAAKGGHHNCCTVMEFGNIRAGDREGNTALHLAAVGGYDITVEKLLQNGADPNTQNKKGIAPILEAAGKKKFGCLRLLAERGADLVVYDKQKKNVLHYAAEKNAIETLRFLLSYPALIANLDEQDKKLCSPLHYAIKKEADECALLLLENGASPVKPCVGGMTPLHLAADKGSTSICEFLLGKREVQVSQENESKATPLHMAALRGSTDVCQMLIRKGARLTAVDDKGKTALHVASAEGHANVVKFLAKKGVPLKARDDTGSCALHLAAYRGSLECCRILVSNAKAICWEFDQNKNLPLDRAFKDNDNSKWTREDLEDHDQVFKFLLMNLCYKANEDRKIYINKYMDTALREKRITIIEAIVDSCWWEAAVTEQNGRQCQTFRILVEMYPSIALELQNKCITHSKENGSSVIYDFRLIEDNYYIPSSVDEKKSPFDPVTHTIMQSAEPFEEGLEWRNNHPTTLMIRHHCHQLLQHPLVKTWLWRKWSSYIYIIFMALLLVEVIFTVVLAVFMGTIDNWTHFEHRGCMPKEDFCNNTTFNITSDNTTGPSDGQNCIGNEHQKYVLWIMLLVLTCVAFLLEVNYMWRLKKEYMKQPENLLQISRTIFTMVILVPSSACGYRHVIIDVTQWQCGIVALLLTWLHLVNTLNQVPFLSVFMPVTLSFVKSFLKVVFYLIMIVFLFAFIFHLLLKEQKAFATVSQAMVKTIVWMLGDLAYDDTFLNDDSDLYYPIMVNFLFVIFVTILGGFIANLVITQPSNKLEDFRDKASFHRAASRTRLFLKLDICFPFFRKHRTIGKYIVNQNRSIDYSFFLKRLLMLDTREETQPVEEVNPIQLELKEMNKQLTTFLSQQSEQRDEIRDLRHQLNFLSKSLMEQKQT